MEVPINCRRQSVTANVELTILVKEWFLDVFLDYIGSLFAVYLGIIYDRLNVIDITADLDACAPVCVLARLNNPHSVTVFGVFDQFWLCGRVLVHLHEFHKFSIVFAFFDVECKGHVIKWIQTLRLVVDFHVVKYGLFVAQVEVVFLVVRRHHMMVRMVLFFLVFLFLFFVVSSNTSLSLCFVST